MKEIVDPRFYRSRSAGYKIGKKYGMGVDAIKEAVKKVIKKR